MLLSAVLFAVVFLLSGLVQATAEVIFGWRMVVTVTFYAMALAHPTPRTLLRQFWRTLTATWWKAVVFVPLCLVMGVQLWLFSWAPQHGHALDASLGFLLMPIALVLGGRIVLRDCVTVAQWVAVSIAVVAVAVKFVLTPQVSWVTFLICIGYPIYFVTRRRVGLDNPMAFGAEVALVTPVALFFIVTAQPQPAGILEFLPLLAIGVAGAGAMATYLAAAQLLPIPLFGPLGYVEMVLLVVVSFMLGERMTGGDVITYGLLATALLMLAVDGYRTARLRYAVMQAGPGPDGIEPSQPGRVDQAPALGELGADPVCDDAADVVEGERGVPQSAISPGVCDPARSYRA